MSTTEYRKFTYQGATFIVGTDGSVDGLRHYSLVGNGYMMLNRKVNGKQKEIVLQKEHAFEVAKKFGVFRPLVCMKGPFDPFWEWYRKTYG